MILDFDVSKGWDLTLCDPHNWLGSHFFIFKFLWWFHEDFDQSWNDDHLTWNSPTQFRKENMAVVSWCSINSRKRDWKNLFLNIKERQYSVLRY